MAKFSLSEIERRANPGVVSRARGYESLVQIVGKEPGRITAKVRGTQLYETTINQESNGHFVQECSCPYGAPCKHTIALARIINNDPMLKSYIEMQEQQGEVPERLWSSGYDYDLLPRASKKIKEKPNLLALLKESLLTRAREVEQVGKGSRERRLSYILSPCVYEGWKSTPRTLISCGIRRAERGLNNPTWKYSRELYPDYYANREVAYMSELDKKITAMLSFPNSEKITDYHHYNRTVLDKIIVNDLLTYLSQMPDVVWQEKEEDPRPMTIKQPQELKLEIVREGSKFYIKPNWETKNVFDYPKPIILTEQLELIPVSNLVDATLLSQVIANPALPAGINHDPQAIMTLLQAGRLLPLTLPTEWTGNIVIGEPVPQITFTNEQGELYRYTISFGYENAIANLLDNEEMAISGDKIFRRNLALESEYVKQMIVLLKPEITVELHDKILIVGRANLFTLIQHLPKVWEVYLTTDTKVKVNRKMGKIETKLSSNIDWLEIEGKVTLGEKEYELARIVEQSMNGEHVMQLDGELHILTNELAAKLKKLSYLYDRKQKTIRLNRVKVGLLEDLSDIIDPKQVGKEWEQLLSVVRNFVGIERVKVPKTLKADLRQYQNEGLNYLNYLQKTQFGGILADDMGLGKTVQAIAMLLVYARSKPKMHVLIVMPSSVVLNWQSELARFAPNLKTVVFAGLWRNWEVAKKVQIILTTYALLRREQARLVREKWDYVILDEAQYAKNVESQTARVVYQLQTKNRLCLSGTPIENNLTELYAQMRFLNPGLFGTLEEFRTNFVLPIEKKQDPQASAHLRRLTKPFILRRTKEEVLTDLPPKTETIQMIELSSKQQKLYEAVRAYYQSQILGLVETQGVARSKLQILEALLRLRQACCDPRLVGLDPRKLPSELREVMKKGESTKLAELLRLVNEAVAEGHKVLIFSQFVEMIKIIGRELKKLKIKQWELTGATPTMKRRDIIQNFQQEPGSGVFLLSLKAGGVGVNLTAADYVIHYDPWWNPSSENQATDRAHRIGQTRSVAVYKLIAKNTIEEKILVLQAKKRRLVEEVLSGGSLARELTREDLEYLLE